MVCNNNIRREDNTEKNISRILSVILLTLYLLLGLFDFHVLTYIQFVPVWV
jgi:hypothetical protein